MTTPTVPNRLESLPIAEYAADRLPGCPQPTLNSSLANRLVERSEFHAWWRHPRLNDEYRQEPPSNIMNLGSAAHVLLLEPERIDDIVPVPYEDWRTGAARELRDKALADGKIPLLQADADRAVLMAQRADLALNLSPDLDGLGQTVSELTYWWRETRVGIDGMEREAYCRARPDMVSRDGAIIISYKTTGQVAEPDAYLRHILNVGYDLQAAFEISAVEAVERVRVTHYVWLVQETEEPYACSLIGMSPALRHLALSRMDQAVLRWGEAIATDRWPGYPSRIAYPEVPSWRLRELEEVDA